MEAHGLSGTLNPAFPRDQQIQFIDYCRRLKDAQNSMKECRLHYAKYSNDPQFQQVLRDNIYQCRDQILEVKEILITEIRAGIWKEPSEVFPKKLAERRQLEEELTKMTGKKVDLGTNFIVDVTMKALEEIK